MNFKTVSAFVFICSFVSSGAFADVITHFGDGPFSDVTTLLNNVGIGGSNVGSETIAETFFVPGISGQDVELTFTFQRDTGTFLFQFGLFDINAISANPLTDRIGYATEVFNSGTLVFDDRNVNPFATSTHTVQAGMQLGFFLLPNNTTDQLLADPDAFFAGSAREPLYSVSDANPGGFDQMLSFVANGVTLFTFEDLTRAGVSDEDFTDLAFTIDSQLIPGGSDPVPEPGTMTLLGLGLVGIAARRSRKHA